MTIYTNGIETPVNENEQPSLALDDDVVDNPAQASELRTAVHGGM